MTLEPAVRIGVEWGYEWHRLEVSPSDWSRIQGGAPVVIAGSGYHHEGEFFEDKWHFNDRGPGTLTVSYGNDLAVGFTGLLTMAEIKVMA